MLKGKRIILKAVRRADLAKILEWFNDAEVIQYLTLYLPMTEKGEEKWLEDISTTRKNSDVVFLMEVVRGKRVTSIGTCGLHRINWKDRDAEFGIAIGEKKFWSNGYGTEATKLILGYAFNHLNLHRVSSGAYDFNERSIKMHLKIGFREEGRVRQSIFKNGQYRDKVLFGILRGEWEEKMKVEELKQKIGFGAAVVVYYSDSRKGFPSGLKFSELVDVYKESPEGSNLRKICQKKILRRAKSFQDWFQTYKTLKDDADLQGKLLSKVKKSARRF